IFLHGAGVPDSFISYLHLLVGHPIDYYTCFISYSSKDQAFAERLYTDLQAVGVRCWFATADLKIGDNWRERIDEAIQLYDKLLLVLSKHSIISRWVEKEVEVALAKESEQKRIILFPIRLDDSIIESTSEWATHLRDSKNIGDFRRWKNYEEYQRAFVRLIENLALSVAKESDKQERAE
ncbi:MAG TPA: toll/interleukin-1 receptor domain-containing protein, partial [Methylomirabilota bacterium]|nr:toll/interleukin-1 receptor domain-containing protein [Methylomirabilota bacterium]